MDDPALDPRRHLHALASLARLNWWSRAVASLWPPIAELARETPRPIRVLDLATGAGDVPIGLARRAAQAGVRLEVSGCDRSPTAIEAATVRARRAGVPASFFPFDAHTEIAPASYDVLTASLFLHHLERAAAVQVLRRMARAAKHLVLVSDLQRTRAGYALAWLGSRVLTRSEIVRTDALRSVRAAYTLEEARALARDAGLNDARLASRWPSRWLLTWKRE